MGSSCNGVNFYNRIESVHSTVFYVLNGAQQSFSKALVFICFEMGVMFGKALIEPQQQENAVELTEKMIANSKTTIICGFSKPKNFKQKLLLWCKFL